MKKIISLLFSIRLTSMLFLGFALAMGLATFIENSYSTQTAKALVYNAWWFHGIFLIFFINFIGNVKRYNLLQKEKRSVFLIHASFILIILGASVTRFISNESLMPIYEGETTNKMLSEKNYVSVNIGDNMSQLDFEEEVLFSEDYVKTSSFLKNTAWFLNKLRGGNSINLLPSFKKNDISISFKKFVSNAKTEFVSDVNGKPYLHLVESANQTRNDHYLEDGDRLPFVDADIVFNKRKDGQINIFKQNDELFIESSRPIKAVTMITQELDTVKPFIATKLKLRTLYTLGNLNFVIPNGIVKGHIKITKGDKDVDLQDALTLSIKANNQERDVTVFGGKFIQNPSKKFTLGNLNFNVSYGAKTVKLPFSVKLNDFILERYPGSESPKAFTSKITVIDEPNNFDYDIYTNHVLDHKGYRFFQNSYNDSGAIEQTQLSVNQDRLGTWLTYAGYILLFLGLIWMLMAPKTYFSKQRKRLKKVRLKNNTVLLIMFFVTFSGAAQVPTDKNVLKEHPSIYVINKTQAKAFGELIVQDFGGRMKPLNTFGSELLRKVSKKDHFYNLDANQFLMSVFVQPQDWNNIPIIYIKKDNTKLRDILGVTHNDKYVKINDFFNADRSYKLRDEVSKASKKKIKSKYEQSLLNVDGRLGILYLAIRGDLFKVFPIPNDDNNKWAAITELEGASTQSKNQDFLSVTHQFNKYQSTIKNNLPTQNYATTNKFIKNLADYQEKYGKEVIPSKKKVQLEVFYNEYDIFKNLFWQYMLGCMVLFLFTIIQVFNKQKKLIRWGVKFGTIVVILLFIYHTIGLAIRWYISGHAPWSNGYESMIYVAWATMFFGIVLGRKSGLTLASTAFVTSMILMIAHWNWMDPTIGNLVPVLDSYWLMIHVAIIVASYGPFAIGMILGMINLLLFIFKTKRNKKRLSSIIDELTIINELTITIGLVMLTVGNFLGGMWANESWGRYWGWDPKETWALISIMVYAFILHMRLVPGLRGKLNFNIATVFAFASILMTYLGVNHLLSGLHSYAAGEAAPIPNEIIGWLIVVSLLSILAIYREKRKQKE